LPPERLPLLLASIPSANQSKPLPRSASTRSASTSARQTSNNTKENNQPKNDPEYWESDAPSAILPRRRRQAAQRNAGIICNVFGQLPSANLGCLTVLALAQVGDHCASRISGSRIIDHRLQSVAYLDAIFAIVGSD